MALDNELLVHESALTQVPVMFVVVVKCLAKKILPDQLVRMLIFLCYMLAIGLPNSEDDGIPQC